MSLLLAATSTCLAFVIPPRQPSVFASELLFIASLPASCAAPAVIADHGCYRFHVTHPIRQKREFTAATTIYASLRLSNEGSLIGKL
jgi:hypothetical protein